jgi:hypothetical protein
MLARNVAIGRVPSLGLAERSRVPSSAIRSRSAFWSVSESCSRFRQASAISQLVAFTITPPRLQVLCHVHTTGEGGGPASIFEARAVGHFVIQTDDGSNSCRSCAILGFEADVTVIEHSNSSRRNSTSTQRPILGPPISRGSGCGAGATTYPPLCSPRRTCASRRPDRSAGSG